LERVYHAYKHRAEFFLVYIREAHPDSVLYTVENGKEVLKKIGQTKTVAERTEVAGQCAATLRLSLPTVVDKEDDKVNIAYAGWPDRLYVIGTDGKIAYKGSPGPQGFKVGEVEDWLKRNTKKTTP
jgi:hypothetical protein